MQRRIRPFTVVFLLMMFCLNRQQVQAQEWDAPYVPPQGLNNWYVELGGAAFLYSLNYEKYLFQNFRQNKLWTARVGVGYNPFDDPDFMHTPAAKLIPHDLTLPFTSSFVYGSGKEKLEFCGGFCLVRGDGGYREVYYTAGIGLRVQESNGFCFRMTYTPYYRYGNLGSWIGVSLGHNFSFTSKRK